AVVTVSATDKTKINTGTVGSYTVTVSNGTGTEKSEKVLGLMIVADNTDISGDKNYWVSGEALIIKSKDLLDNEASDNDVTDAEYRALHNVLAGHINADGTATTDTAVVTVSAADKAKINAGTVGSYTVTVSNGTGTEKSEKVLGLMIVADNTDISGDKNYWVSGEALIIKSKDLLDNEASDNDVTDAEYRALHNVLAGHINADGTATADTAVVTVNDEDKAKINTGTVGSYTVTVSNGIDENKAEKIVQLIIVSDNAEISDDGRYWIYAESKSVESRFILWGIGIDRMVTDDELFELHLVNAGIINSDGSVTMLDPEITTQVDMREKINMSMVGTYPLTFKVGDDASEAMINVVLTITPNPKDPPEPGRTCQDDGYPEGYHWNEEAQACVLGGESSKDKGTGVKKTTTIPTKKPEVDVKEIATPKPASITTDKPTINQKPIIVNESSTKQPWALVNLAFLLGIILSAIVLVVVRKEEEEIDGEEITFYYRRKIYMVILLLLAIIASAFFTFTSDFSAFMVFTNKWTIWIFCLFVASEICLILGLIWKQEN
ncbi:hypothetical protein, partial [Anaerorhabdus sp.]|uniref:hypothetical protein n=1 Tax=Anaerorhabdus sp. TaxID=1872524 RepID=UPI002B1F1A1B